ERHEQGFLGVAVPAALRVHGIDGGLADHAGARRATRGVGGGGRRRGRRAGDGRGDGGGSGIGDRVGNGLGRGRVDGVGGRCRRRRRGCFRRRSGHAVQVVIGRLGPCRAGERPGGQGQRKRRQYTRE